MTVKEIIITGKCMGTKKDGVSGLCQCMEEVVQAQGSGKGLKYLLVLTKQMTTKQHIVYGITAKRQALVNYCPFCGGVLYDEEENNA